MEILAVELKLVNLPKFLQLFLQKSDPTLGLDAKATETTIEF